MRRKTLNKLVKHAGEGQGLRDFGRKTVDLAPGEPTDEERNESAMAMMAKLPKRRGKPNPPPVVTQVLEDLSKLKAKKAKLPRPSIPIKVQLQVALEQLRIAMWPGEDKLQLDHNPALENRKFDPATGKYMPDANDPRYLMWMPKGAHDKKTHGPGGTKRITTAGSDNHQREHRESLSASEAKHHEAMAKKGKPVVPRRT